MLLLSTDDQKDRFIWSRYRQGLTPDRVTSIQIGDTALSETDQVQVLNWLKAADFKKSNRIGHGPTPDQVLTVTFSDGTREHFGFWGGDTFETGPRVIDPRSQFLITSQPLGNWLKQRKP